MEHNPPATTTPAERAAVERALGALFAGLPPSRAALLPVLLAAQAAHGWLSRGILAEIAEALGLPFPDVWGVATFYAQLRLLPPADVAVQVCDDVPCRLRGAADLLAAVEARFGPARRFDGRAHAAPEGPLAAPAAVEVEAVPCMGRCDSAPMAVVAGRPCALADAAALLAAVAAAGGKTDG